MSNHLNEDLANTNEMGWTPSAHEWIMRIIMIMVSVVECWTVFAYCPNENIQWRHTTDRQSVRAFALANTLRTAMPSRGRSRCPRLKHYKLLYILNWAKGVLSSVFARDDLLFRAILGHLPPYRQLLLVGSSKAKLICWWMVSEPWLWPNFDHIFWNQISHPGSGKIYDNEETLQLSIKKL